jgi:hypothetical protein
MNLLKFVLKVLLELLKTIAYGWVLIIIEFIKRLIQTIKQFCAYLKLPHADQTDLDDKCAHFDHPALHQPDPCIYSQQYLLSLGLPVTWDNPDISLLLNGVVVPETNLLPDTEYEIDATIWNNSFDAPVVGLRIEFSFLSFGASTVSNPIGATYVDLGVKSGPNCPALAKMLWRTPAIPGHYCIQVNILWADDANPGNNLGQNNVDVVAAHSPADFVFRLRNNTDTAQDYSFQVDTYAIPPQPDCADRITAADRGNFAQRLTRIKAVHNRANFPIPPGWTVGIVPPAVTLPSGDETDIHVTISPPAGFTGATPFNVNVVYKKRYAGGVTLYVTKA